MKKYLKVDPWSIIEEGFNPGNVCSSESIFSLANGKMGQRANFEERYSGDTLQGNYFAGIFYPDKTRVGWWKVGYPEYFGKMINSINWLGIDIEFDGIVLDLAKCRVTSFRRELNMKEGSLSRQFEAELPGGKIIQVKAKRFISIADTEIAAISYSIVCKNFNSEIKVLSYLDGDVKNKDSNYNEKFWDEVSKTTDGDYAYLELKTKKLDFHVGSAMRMEFFLNNSKNIAHSKSITKDKYAGLEYHFNSKKGDELLIYKYLGNSTSLDYPRNLKSGCDKAVDRAIGSGYDKLFDAHRNKWNNKWEHSDILIEGDAEAQQGIRFNIFHLNQTYTGDDTRLNIGPKGFTGEKYGGSTYWDTEAFCFPFYMNTASSLVARNLLLYRYKQLDKAIENGEKLGFNNGAALFPMVTVNGEECHNEWEITFEEIHRNGAIAYAIYNYIRHTGDNNYIVDYGLELLIALARFWSQRASFSEVKQKYVILGVTGPNEYENNVNNNWYTNFMARWTLKYTLECIQLVKAKEKQKWNSLKTKINFDEDKESSKWESIIDSLFFPVIEGTNIFLQQEGYLDKELLTVKDIPPDQRPINQHWSWDRILRSCFLKQADVLQGLYFFIDEFKKEVVKDNFKYYEQRTVHESSLSASIHSVLASHIGDIEKAYELYLRTSRLDIDDYNNEAHEGLHITSMAGTWLSIVEGFGRKRITGNTLSFSPLIPDNWKLYSFKILWKEAVLEIKVSHQKIEITNHHTEALNLLLYNESITIPAGATAEYEHSSEFTKV